MPSKMERLLDRVDRALRWGSSKAHPAAVGAAAVLVLIAGYQAREWVITNARAAQERLSSLREDAARTAQAAAEIRLLRDLKARDIAQFKKGLSKMTESRRSIYETGLMLQEERRLLDKQWEIMTTYLLVDEEAGKINLMRGEQSLESYPYGNPLPQQFGPEIRPLRDLSRIVSKERFASPERGKYEEVNGQLQWEPPQMGASIRANALGEYVMFTDGPLVLHGAPIKPEEHSQFPHYCLGLTTRVAHKLYDGTFIGTKILLRRAAHPPDE